jgi:hypothetical protein
VSKFILGLFLGLFTGGFFGVLTTALLVASGRSNDQYEKNNNLKEEEKTNNSNLDLLHYNTLDAIEKVEEDGINYFTFKYEDDKEVKNDFV